MAPEVGHHVLLTRAGRGAQRELPVVHGPTLPEEGAPGLGPDVGTVLQQAASPT